MKTVAPPSPAERPLTTDELCVHYSVTPRTLQNWRDRGLPCIRINARTFRYRLSEVEKFLTRK